MFAVRPMSLARTGIDGQPRTLGESYFNVASAGRLQNGLLTDYKVIVLAMERGAWSVLRCKKRHPRWQAASWCWTTPPKIIGLLQALTKGRPKADVPPIPLIDAASRWPLRKDIRSSTDPR